MGNSNNSFMKIGELAKKLNVTTRTVRYYEELGIITPAQRTSGHFRLYSQKEFHKIRLIQNLKLLDLPLEHIKDFIRMFEGNSKLNKRSLEIIEFLNNELKIVEEKIKQYKNTRKSIKEAIELIKICENCNKDVNNYISCSECNKIKLKGNSHLFT